MENSWSENWFSILKGESLHHIVYKIPGCYTFLCKKTLWIFFMTECRVLRCMKTENMY